MQSEGLKIVVSGPSGAGKGTIVKELIKDKDFIVSISATTRSPRIGEEHGTHYFFKTKDEFEKMIEEKALLEYACFCDNYYGTPKAFIEEQVAAGQDVILEIEVQGAMQVKSVYPEAIFVFVMPPTLADLRERLIGRGTETLDVVEKRLARAREELAQYKEYDYIVVNDDLEQAVADIKSIAKSEKVRSYRYKKMIESMLAE